MVHPVKYWCPFISLHWTSFYFNLKSHPELKLSFICKSWWFSVEKLCWSCNQLFRFTFKQFLLMNGTFWFFSPKVTWKIFSLHIVRRQKMTSDFCQQKFFLLWLWFVFIFIMPKKDTLYSCGAVSFNKTQNLPVLPLTWFAFPSLQSLRFCFQESVLVCVFISLCCYVHSWVFCALWCGEWIAFAGSNGESLALLCLSQTHLWLVLANGHWTIAISSELVQNPDLN